ncbi:MAG TPA: gamma-glutamyltransferase [Usitatibacter sp.]|nr:gamma-glutamyltransferase [Usitatibacter sp.]
MAVSSKAVVLAAAALAASLAASAQLRPSQPEAASGWTAKHVATARKYMVAAAHPLAVEAGVRMLERGGSAVDAMVATQLVLNLVEPTSSGLGGGAFLLYYDARHRKLHAYDGREVAPAGATPELFLTPEGKAMAFAQARVGGRSVGVPGTPRLLELAHVRHGKLPWKALFGPALRTAQEGFPVSPRLHRLIGEDRGLADQPAARAYFFDGEGQPKAVGTVLRNPQFAATLRALRDGGADAFYRGGIASDIVAAVRNHPNPGTLSLEDLAGYRVREVEPLCGSYRALKLCGMPPSSSGGIAVLQVLGMLERFDMASMRPDSAGAVHLVSEAERLAFADRGKYVADDRFVDVPVKGLIDRGYIASRSQLIRPEKSMGKAQPGVPPGVRIAFAQDPVDEVMGTTQISIVDAEGNAVSMTTTIEAFFGSRVMVRGFLLNNELTDFNFLPVEDGAGVANRVAPGKRPRSSMAPFVAFDGKGRLDIVIGSPGGSLIIGYVAKALLGMVDWKLDIQRAIDLPNFGSRNGPTEIEKGTELQSLAATLKAMGHDVRAIDMTSGLQGIRRTATGWQGGADPRREGVARGH